jgi:hypothetical protein
MKTPLLISLLSFVCWFNSFGQKNDLSIKLDSGVFYSGKLYGGSTNAIRMVSRHADSIPEVIKTHFLTASLDTISLLLSAVKRQRHFQQKIGKAKYAKVYHGGHSMHLAFIPGWAILHFDGQRNYQYVIRGTPYEKTFDRLVNTNWH